MSVRITDKEVFKRLEVLERNNTSEHNKIMMMVEGYNDQVARMKWALLGIGALTVVLLGWLIQIKMSGAG